MCGPVTAMHFSGSGGWDTRRSARPREHLAAKASQAPAERGHVCHQVWVKLWHLSPGVCKVPREAYETLGRCHPHRSVVCCVPVREAALPPAASLAPAGPARKGEASPPPHSLPSDWLAEPGAAAHPALLSDVTLGPGKPGEIQDSGRWMARGSTQLLLRNARRS